MIRELTRALRLRLTQVRTGFPLPVDPHAHPCASHANLPCRPDITRKRLRRALRPSYRGTAAPHARLPPPKDRHARERAGAKPTLSLSCTFYTANEPAVRLSAGHGLAHVGGHARRGAAPRAPAAAARTTARAIGMAVAHAAAPQTAHCPCGPCNHDQQDRHGRQVEFQTQDHGPSPFLSCTPMPAREKCFPWIILRTTAGRHPKAASRLKQLTSSQNRHRWFSGPITGLARWARRYFSCFSSRLGMGRKIWNSMAAAMTMATTVNTLNSTSPVARPTNW